MAFGKFAKYTPGSITYNPVRIDLVNVLRDCVNFARQEFAPTRDVHFETFAATRMLTTDPEHVRLIAINLLQNALKYSADESRVVLEVFERDGHAGFLVADQGIGIPPDALEQLYSPFYRATNVADKPGTGLGLAILKSSAKTLGADIDVETELGNGTTFRVLLPERRFG